MSKQPPPLADEPGQQRSFPTQARPLLHEQRPDEHVSPGRQVTPHPPQLAGSFAVFTQVEPQQVMPRLQRFEPPHRQRPWIHVSPGLQARPHSPQLAGSFAMFRQPTPGQQVSLAAQSCPLHVQFPLTQVRPGGHARPQAPQCWLFEERFTHVLPPQQTSGVVHDVVPHAQLFPVEHPLPAQHSPLGPQSRPPGWPSQVQAPPEHVSPGLHIVSQLPQ